MPAQPYDALNPPIEVKEPTEYMRYSQGSLPDTSLGTLFEGLGNATTSATKVADSYYKNTIREEVTAASDEITDSFTGRGPVPAGATPDPTTPDEITRTGERMQRLNAGVKAGTVLNSHYWGLLDMESRRLRAKYPGYREQIDNVFSDVTGSVPANALRKALMEEAKAGSKADPDKERKHWEEKVITQTPYGKQVTDRASSGSPMSVLELQGLAARHFSSTTETAAGKAELELKQAKGEDVRHEANKEASSTVWKSIADASTNVELGNLLDTAKKYRSAGPDGLPKYSPQEEQAITAGFEQFRSKVNANARMITTSYMKQGLHPQDAETIHKTVETVLKNIEEDITRGRIQSVATYKSVLEGLQSGDKVSMLTSNETLRRYSVLRDVLGPEGFNLTLDKNPEELSRFSRQVYNHNLTNMFVPGAPGAPAPSLLDEHLKNVSNGVTDKKVYNASREFLLNAVKEPAVKPEARTRAVDALYGPRNMKYLDDINVGGTVVDQKGSRNVRSQLYSKMASPEMTAKMLELKNAGDEESWKKYSTWVMRNGAMLTATPAQSLLPILGEPRAGVEVGFDPQTNTMRLMPPRASNAFPGGGTVESGWNAHRLAAQQWVQELNSVIQPMVSVDQGGVKELAPAGQGTATKGVERVLNAHGLDLVPGENGQMVLKPLAQRRLGGPGERPFGDEGSQAEPVLYKRYPVGETDEARFNEAQELETNGMTNHDIWRTTGWFKDTNNEWVSEIDDSRASFNQGWNKNETSTIGNILDHKELYNVDPTARDIPVRLFDPEKVGVSKTLRGSYYPPSENLPQGVIFLNKTIDEDQLLGTVLHELQHRHQPQSRVQREIQTQEYDQRASEREAQDTAGRRDLTTGERNQTPPRHMQGKEEQILQQHNELKPFFSPNVPMSKLGGPEDEQKVQGLLLSEENGKIGPGMLPQAAMDTWENIKNFMSSGDEISAFKLAATLTGGGMTRAAEGSVGSAGGRFTVLEGGAQNVGKSEAKLAIVTNEKGIPQAPLHSNVSDQVVDDYLKGQFAALEAHLRKNADKPTYELAQRKQAAMQTSKRLHDDYISTIEKDISDALTKPDYLMTKDPHGYLLRQAQFMDKLSQEAAGKGSELSGFLKEMLGNRATDLPAWDKTYKDAAKMYRKALFKVLKNET